MSNILKIEAFAGMSGDMFLGALAGLAEAYDSIVNLPALLHLGDEVEIHIKGVNKNGIACKHVKVIDKKATEDQGHHDQGSGQHGHSHDHEHEHHHHDHDPDDREEHHHHDHEHHHRPHRHLKHIYEIIDHGDLSERAQRIAKKIFRLLGESESQVHGIDIEKVHFHEVGAIDSIIDIVGTAWLLDQLDIERSYCTTVTTGFGFAWTEHGKLPVPCPATQKLLHGFPTTFGEYKGELTTPTGAAILKYLDPSFEIPPLTEMKTSYGPGEKDLEIPNTLRLSLCRGEQHKDKMFVIQTNIDDFSGEYLGIEFQQKLFEYGAVDFYYQQVIMKKGRPGIVLTVIAPQRAIKAVSDIILEDTSTIGLRYYAVDRVELERNQKEFTTPFGKVRAKEVVSPGGKRRIKPESDDVFQLSRENDISPLDVVRKIEQLNSDEEL